MTDKTTNVVALRNRLLEVFDDLRAGKISLEQAKTICNAASQIISSAKAELAHAVACKETPKVEFLK